MANIREVAGRAGVSPTTVSHVVNATRFVSHEIRARVMEAMTELGYHPNAVARSLRRGRTHTLGLVLPDSANPYFAELGRGIETAAFGRIIDQRSVGILDLERGLDLDKAPALPHARMRLVSGSLGGVGPSRSASRPPRAWSAWTSTSCAAGAPGTAGPRWRCSPTPSWWWRR